MRWWQRGVREHPRIDVTVKPALERLRVNEWLTWGYLMLPYLSARLNNRLALRAGVNDGAGIHFQRAEINRAARQPSRSLISSQQWRCRSLAPGNQVGWCVRLGGKKTNELLYLNACGHGFFLILQTLGGPSWPVAVLDLSFNRGARLGPAFLLGGAYNPGKKDKSLIQTRDQWNLK